LTNKVVDLACYSQSVMLNYFGERQDALLKV